MPLGTGKYYYIQFLTAPINNKKPAFDGVSRKALIIGKITENNLCQSVGVSRKPLLSGNIT